jgi:hypothetical protein
MNMDTLIVWTGFGCAAAAWYLICLWCWQKTYKDHENLGVASPEKLKADVTALAHLSKTTNRRGHRLGKFLAVSGAIERIV